MTLVCSEEAELDKLDEHETLEAQPEAIARTSSKKKKKTSIVFPEGMPLSDRLAELERYPGSPNLYSHDSDPGLRQKKVLMKKAPVRMNP